jgi:hypothetical protein
MRIEEERALELQEGPDLPEKPRTDTGTAPSGILSEIP